MGQIFLILDFGLFLLNGSALEPQKHSEDPELEGRLERKCFLSVLLLTCKLFISP